MKDFSVISAVFDAAKFVFKEAFKKKSGMVENSAQFLSLAIAGEYRSLEFYRATKVKLAKVLFQYAIDQQKKSTIKKIFLVVEKKNMLARAFYANIGFVETEACDDFGLPSLKYEMNLSY